MHTHTSCSFEITGWDEQPYQTFENGAKLTRAKVTQAYQGAVDGEGTVEFLMAHAADGTASFVGLERVEGTVHGKSGGFVVRHVGTYDSGGARSDCSIVPGSGSRELTGITGQGSYVATGKSVPMSFSYELPGA